MSTPNRRDAIEVDGVPLEQPNPQLPWDERAELSPRQLREAAIELRIRAQRIEQLADEKERVRWGDRVWRKSETELLA